MVTLRKVSLRLADHHIGITHGGDGCSRRIVDFDKDRAIEIGAEAEKEAEISAKMNELRQNEAQQVGEDMPEVPEPLSAPKSLGGLLKHIEQSNDSDVDDSMQGLSERTAEMTEDIEEMQELREAVKHDSEKEPESIELDFEEEL